MTISHDATPPYNLRAGMFGALLLAITLASYATQAIGIGKTPWRMFVGYLENYPVATNMLYNGAGVASVYAVGVVPAARGKDIGGAVTLKPLLEARDLGYRHAVLFSTEMAQSVYERIGFRFTGTRINRYLWRNA